MKTKLQKLFITLAVVTLFLGCQTVNKSAVILSDVEDTIMKAWATAHNDHLTTTDLDRKVMAAHASFEDAKKVAATALRTYSAGGDRADYVKALEAAQAAVGPLLELLSPVLSPAKIASFQTDISLATKP